VEANNQPYSLSLSNQQHLHDVLTPLTAVMPSTISFVDNTLEFTPTNSLVSSDLELVLFTRTSVKQLALIINQCQLNLLALTAINSRNQLSSIRLDISCENLNEARAELVKICLVEKIEAAIVEAAPMLSKPGLLVMDMDSTTIEIECIDEIAKLAGVGEKVAEVTELAMQGELDFAQSLHQRVATLAGAPATILSEVASNIPLMPGLNTLITALKQHNWRIAIASGGFTYFADHLKNTLLLDDAVANTLEIADQHLTGKVLGDVVDANVKAQTLSLLAKKYDIDDKQTVAMGDGANDLMMMAAAHLGVAYKAKPLVLAQADSCISHSGLDCLLHWLK